MSTAEPPSCGPVPQGADCVEEVAVRADGVQVSTHGDGRIYRHVQFGSAVIDGAPFEEALLPDPGPAGMDLRRGDRVLLARDRLVGRNSVEMRTVPRVVRVLTEQRGGHEVPFSPVTDCPECGSSLVRRLLGQRERMFCPNQRTCPAQVLPRLRRLSRREGFMLPFLDPFGVRPRWLLTATPLVNEEGLFDLTRDEVGDRFFDALMAARRAPAARVLGALSPHGGRRPGEPVIGSREWWTLLHQVGSIPALTDASADQVCAAGILAPVAERIVAWFNVPWHRELVQRWAAAGVTMKQPAVERTLVGVRVGLRSPGLGRAWPGISDLSAVRRWEDRVYERGGEPVMLTPRRNDSSELQYVFDLTVLHPRCGDADAAASASSLTGMQFEELLRRGPAGQAAETAGPRTVDDMWRAARRAHPDGVRIGTRGPLPVGNPVMAGEGALYMCTRETQQIVVIVASSLGSAVEGLGVGSPVASFDRTEALWVPGSIGALRLVSPVLRAPMTALRRGRPHLVRSDADWVRVPHVAGIYRITLRDHFGECIYVGRSQDLRIRPRQHEKTAGLQWSDGLAPGKVQIELLYVKAAEQFHAWTVTDLDDAEAAHIRRAQQRFLAGEGPRVLNITGGRNGPPSRPKTQVYVWRSSSGGCVSSE